MILNVTNWRLMSKSIGLGYKENWKKRNFHKKLKVFIKGKDTKYASEFKSKKRLNGKNEQLTMKTKAWQEKGIKQ